MAKAQCDLGQLLQLIIKMANAQCDLGQLLHLMNVMYGETTVYHSNITKLWHGETSVYQCNITKLSFGMVRPRSTNAILQS